MLPKGPARSITFLDDPSVFKKKVVTVDPSSLSPRWKARKYIKSYVDCAEFLPYLERTCYENITRRRLTPYVPVRFSRQFGYSQIKPNQRENRKCTLQDASYAWIFFSAFNIGASF